MFKRLYNAWKQYKTRKNFSKTAIFDSNTNFFTCAYCLNSGKKENIYIGKHCYIGAQFQVWKKGKVTIGNNVYIGGNTLLQCVESISIQEFNEG